mmetsp:Transcript_24225/g.43735  ORF Transcript_24225/g.43735 Transcript_24225/m.43735 type:complete len:251 (+) Transcript_24225:745-1497(+)
MWLHASAHLPASQVIVCPRTPQTLLIAYTCINRQRQLAQPRLACKERADRADDSIHSLTSIFLEQLRHNVGVWLGLTLPQNIWGANLGLACHQVPFWVCVQENAIQTFDPTIWLKQWPELVDGFERCLDVVFLVERLECSSMQSGVQEDDTACIALLLGHLLHPIPFALRWGNHQYNLCFAQGCCSLQVHFRISTFGTKATLALLLLRNRNYCPLDCCPLLSGSFRLPLICEGHHHRLSNWIKHFDKEPG